jgi:AcrR family transcriptional regulator
MPHRRGWPPEANERRGQGRAHVSGGIERGEVVDEDPARERIAVAMIELVGDQGLEMTTVAMVCDRAGVDRPSFDRCFGGKEDCFLRIHGALADEFCSRVSAAYAGPRSWHDRIWAAAWAAMGFLREDALRARFFVVEVNGAGNRAQARRDRVLQGFADLIDAGREELEEPASMSRSTAEMVAGAIYGTILTKVKGGAIERGEDFLAELVYMAMMPYIGARAAEDELLVQSLH